MIYHVPIEPIEARYSATWFKGIPALFAHETVTPMVHVVGTGEKHEIKDGAFLDVTGTMIWKSEQLAHLLRYIQAGRIGDNDVILFHDLWFPGLEALFYARAGLGLKFKIAGLLHAGTYDEQDWTVRKGMRKWGHYLENAWFNEVDLIFVATDYHRRLVSEHRVVNSGKLAVVPFPAGWPSIIKAQGTIPPKSKIVVFPHRLDPEKQPEVFDKLAEKLRPDFPQWQFVKSMDVCKSKAQYYQLLAHSSIAYSSAMQETWGIAMQEATIMGCIPVVPDDLSYSEMYPNFFKYDPLEDDDGYCVMRGIMEHIDAGERGAERLFALTHDLGDQFEDRARNAANAMLNHMQRRGWAV